MARIVKCRFCEVKESSDLMTKGVHPQGYIHNKCIPAYEEDRRKKEIEKEEWSLLYEYVKTLHNAVDVPPRNIKRLHEIKQSKNISYKLIFDAYKIAEDKIKWFMDSVLDNENDAKAINACITVMLNDGLNAAFKQEQIRKKREEEKNKITVDVIADIDEDPFLKNKSKKDDMDISKFL